MNMLQFGDCRVCEKPCIWMPFFDGVLAGFEVCSAECLKNCKDAQEILQSVEKEKDE